MVSELPEAKFYCLSTMFRLRRMHMCLAAILLFPQVAWAEWAEKHFDTIEADANLEISNSSVWLADYQQACTKAIKLRKPLLIHFQGSSECPRHLRFINDTCVRQEICQQLKKYVCLRVPSHDLSVHADDKGDMLLRNPTFAAMQEIPGLAVVDFSDANSDTFGEVIGVLPFTKQAYYAPPYESPLSVATFLRLPPGPLSERMMIYAIRIHPERPRSTAGTSSPILRKAAADHSQRQASLGRQGHQQWELRFHRIWDQIGGKPPIEVCAESWPDESLITACLGCVHAWRQSAGHWQSVAGRHLLFGYSIHRGANRIWYATGIFGG